MFEAISNSNLQNVLELILIVISLFVSYYAVPYITDDLIPMLKEKHLYDVIKKFVQAAEKLAESGVIKKADKKDMVIKLLESKGIVVSKVTESFIESAVKELDIVTSVIYEEIAEDNKNKDK